MKWISHMYTYTPSLDLPPTPLPSRPSRSSQLEHLTGLPVPYGRFPRAISFTPGSVSMSILISQSSHSFLPLLHSHVCSLHQSSFFHWALHCFVLISKITVDGDCSHEIKRWFLLERKAMANIVKVFPVVMYRCESWTIKKAECQRTDTSELWC